MTRLRRLVCALTVSTTVLTGCALQTEAGGDKRPSPAITSPPSAPVPTLALPRCKFPKKVAFPEWVPDDLPLPDGIYATEHLSRDSGYLRGFFVLPRTSTIELTKLVLKEWPKAGYTLGRGDAEPGEVEDDFHKPPAVGAFKANDVYCDPGYSIMYLIWAPDGPTGQLVLPSPTSKGAPLNG
jgi:hypothetical protein